jgi:hypothetical protein
VAAKQFVPSNQSSGPQIGPANPLDPSKLNPPNALDPNRKNRVIPTASQFADTALDAGQLASPFAGPLMGPLLAGGMGALQAKLRGEDPVTAGASNAALGMTPIMEKPLAMLGNKLGMAFGSVPSDLRQGAAESMSRLRDMLRGRGTPYGATNPLRGGPASNLPTDVLSGVKRIFGLGDEAAPVLGDNERMMGIKKRLGNNLQTVEEQSPAKISLSVLDDSQPEIAKLRSKVSGGHDPLTGQDAISNTVNRVAEGRGAQTMLNQTGDPSLGQAAWDAVKASYKSNAARQGLPVPSDEEILQSMKQRISMTGRQAGELQRSLTQGGDDILQQRIARQPVPPADAFRGQALDALGRTMRREVNAAIPAVKPINKALGDTHNVLDTMGGLRGNDTLTNPGTMTRRAGLGSTVAGQIAPGNDSGRIGKLIGLFLNPTNFSRAGNMAATAAEGAPGVYRSMKLLYDMFNPPPEAPNK